MICVTIVWLQIVEFHKINPMIGTGGLTAPISQRIKNMLVGLILNITGL